MGRFKEILEQKRKELYEQQYVTILDGSMKHITDFADKSVDSKLHNDLRMNSYAKSAFFPKLTDNELINTTRYYLNNVKPYSFPATTYDESLVHEIIPELLSRLEECNVQIKEDANKLTERFTEETKRDPYFNGYKPQIFFEV